jgi:hypothetical protein
MRAIVVIMANIIRQKFLVNSHDVIEEITAAASHPALGHSILPGTLDRGLYGGDLQGANASMYFQTVFLIMIEEQESGNGLVGEGFSELLHDPMAAGMASNIAVHNLPPVVPNNKEAVQQLEGDRGDGEEIPSGVRRTTAEILLNRPL